MNILFSLLYQTVTVYDLQQLSHLIRFPAFRLKVQLLI